MLKQKKEMSICPFPRPIWAFVGVLILVQVGAGAITGLDWTKDLQLPAVSGYPVGSAFGNTMWVSWYDANWNSEIFSTSDGVNWVQVTKPVYIPAWSSNGRVWTSDFDYSTADGITWTKTPYTLPTIPNPTNATGGTLAVFNGRLWSLGGEIIAYQNPFGDVYYQTVPTVFSSADGQSPWSSYTAPWVGRVGHSATVFNGKLWIMGGVYFYSDAGPHLDLNDVWFTDDGQNWTQAPNAPWSPRENHATVVADGKMWVLGGYDQVHYMNDVWYTSDGTHWTQVTAAAPWYTRESFSCLVFNNKIWVIGGFGAGYLNDIWYSAIPNAAIAADPAPANGWYPAGQNLNLTVTATGFNGDLTYQWHKDGQIITDATDAVYQVSQLGTSDTGAYTCDVIDSAATSATAGPVRITVYEGKLPVGGFAPLIAAALIGFLYLTRSRGETG